LTQNLEILGTRISTLAREDIESLVLESLSNNIGLRVHLCNTYTLYLSVGNPELKTALQSADLNLPDGWPIASLGRKHGIRNSIRGSDLFDGIVRNTQNLEASHFFLGGTVEELSKMTDKLRVTFPDVKIAGTFAPGFKDFDDADYENFSNLIRESGASIVWVGLGTPKQDIAVERLGKKNNKLIVIPIGAVFGFWSGSIKEAPPSFQKFRLEWFYRLTQEPSKLWKRYFIGAPIFLILVIREKLKRRLG
jgi:N-acetylglucosaminyldiphosphoundecaprenol N-acetyl-beta-D-mannosaminyltransferase